MQTIFNGQESSVTTLLPYSRYIWAFGQFGILAFWDHLWILSSQKIASGARDSPDSWGLFLGTPGPPTVDID